MQKMCKDLDDGETQFKNINDNAKVLLASHLDTYVSNQLRHLNSRYQVILLYSNRLVSVLTRVDTFFTSCLQVQINLAKDVLKKIETNVEQHKNYESSLSRAKAWIEKAKQTVKDCCEVSSNSSQETLREKLNQIEVRI